jgi:hypothetical protein
MRFMVPPTALHRLVRNALLRASQYARPLRRFVNSGRLSEPFVYADSPIVVSGGERLDVSGRGFVILAPGEIALPETPVPVEVTPGRDSQFVLVRPDGHVAGRTDEPHRLVELLTIAAGGHVDLRARLRVPAA